MNAPHTLPHCALSFDILIPVDGHDAYSFGHGAAELDDDAIAAIAAFVEPRGAALMRDDDRFWFVTPRLIADAFDDFAGALCVDLANAQLLPLTAYS